MRPENGLIRIWRFYRNGFREMTWGRTLWWLILIKLAIMFLVLKWIFFPNFLGRQVKEGESKSHYVGRELVERATQTN